MRSAVSQSRRAISLLSKTGLQPASPVNLYRVDLSSFGATRLELNSPVTQFNSHLAGETACPTTDPALRLSNQFQSVAAHTFRRKMNRESRALPGRAVDVDCPTMRF